MVVKGFKRAISPTLIILFLPFACSLTGLDSWAAKQEQLAPSDGHKAHVLAVAFSPDGKLIVSGGGDNTIRIWDRKTGKHLKVLNVGIMGRVESVAVSPDGKHVVSAGYFDRKIRLWDVQKGIQLAAFPGFSIFGAWSAVFSPDGKQIISGGADGTVRIYDIASKKQLKVLKGHAPGTLSDVLSVALSPDGQHVASASFDMTICIWDRSTGKKIRVIEGHDAEVCSVAYSPDGKYLASASSDQTVRLWDSETGKQIKIFHGHKGIINSVAFSPDGRYIVSGGNDKTLRLWDVRADGEEKIYTGHDGIVYAVAFSPDGKQIASGGRDKKLMLWDGETPKLLKTLERRIYKPPICRYALPLTGALIIILYIIYFCAKIARKDVRAVQQNVFSDPPGFMAEFNKALSVETDSPKAALRTYNRLLRKNREYHWNLLVLVIVSPVMAFFISYLVRNCFNLPAWAATLFIWFPLGFYPFYSAQRKLRYELSGRTEPPVNFLELAIGFFSKLFPLFIVTFTALFSTMLIILVSATFHWLTTGHSFSQSAGKMSAYLGIPSLIIIFVGFSLIFISNPKKVFSPRRLLVSLKLTAKDIGNFYLNAFITLAMTVSITGYFYRNPLQGAILSVAIGIFEGIGGSRMERYFLPQHFINLAKIRCQMLLGRRLEAEWHLQFLEFDTKRINQLWLVHYLSSVLLDVLDKRTDLRETKRWIERKRSQAVREFGYTGRATVKNSETLLFRSKTI